MFRLYSASMTERIIKRLTPRIRSLSARYAIPAPVLQAMLYQEISKIDVLDIAADLLVRFNWLRLTLRGKLDGEMPSGLSLWNKLDSSTGYAQIFARVGIDAINFALDRGLTTMEALKIPVQRRLDRDRPRDVRLIWRLLKRNKSFNLELAALNLLSAAEEKTGRTDFSSFSPEELKLIFTRYNGTSRSVSAYGKAAYQQYLRYQEINKAAV